jgi:hypothetical protein
MLLFILFLKNTCVFVLRIYHLRIKEKIICPQTLVQLAKIVEILRLDVVIEVRTPTPPLICEFSMIMVILSIYRFKFKHCRSNTNKRGRVDVYLFTK